MRNFDVAIIGSGINSLSAAAILSKKGHKVAVIERNDWIGGCIKTEELIAPGFKTDVFSGWHPLYVTGPAYGVLKEDLEKNGLEYVNTEIPAGIVTPDNRSAILYTNRDKNIELFNQLSSGDGNSYNELLKKFEADSELVFHLLSHEPQDWSSIFTVIKTARKKGLKEFKRDAGFMAKSADKLLGQYFESDLIKALFAPWILHTGLGPNDAAGSIMIQILIFSLEAAGIPIPKGGGGQLVNALMKIIEDNGGEFFINEDVSEILVENKKVRGVRTQSEEYSAKYVLANVTPQQLYEELLPESYVSEKLQREVENYRYGNGGMQIHYALEGSLNWGNSELNKAAVVNLTSGVEAVSRSVNEAYNGLLPSEPTVAVGQHTALDPSRAPAGKHTLWIQLLEMPRELKGDALGEIDTSNGYSEEVIEAFIARIENRIAKHAPNFKDLIINRKVLSPVDLEANNRNLVGGDPYCGTTSIDQFLLWRPTADFTQHGTPVKNLFHIGAATHPGPGLNGTSGYLAAQQIK